MEFIRKPLWALFALLALDYQQTHAMEKKESEQCYISQIPIEMKCRIINEIFFREKTDKTNFRNIGINLSLVCKDWSGIIKKDAKRWVCEHFNIDEKDKDVFWRLFKGKFIYKPKRDNDKGRVDFFISALPNPLEGTFDLSNFDNIVQHLSISTGYRKVKKAEKAEKIEVWLTPRFLVEKEINSTAKHFKEICPSKWNDDASVGIFWNWGGWDDLGCYDYLTSESMDNLSKICLFKNWKKGVRCGVSPGGVVDVNPYVWARFHVSFVS